MPSDYVKRINKMIKLYPEALEEYDRMRKLPKIYSRKNFNTMDENVLREFKEYRRRNAISLLSRRWLIR